MSELQQPPSHLKQRIIGAVVLIAVIVIFVPMLLQHSPSDTTSVANLPKRPQVSQPDFATQNDFVKSTQPTTEAPIAQAWVIQLGSFSQKRYAEDLVERLQAYGFSGYTYPAMNGKQKIVRVYVGPEIKKAQAQQLQQDLQQKMGLKGQIVPFNPLNS